jgi:hypothetical protein
VALPQRFPLASEAVSPTGAYLLDNGRVFVLYLGRALPNEFLQQARAWCFVFLVFFCKIAFLLFYCCARRPQTDRQRPDIPCTLLPLDAVPTGVCLSVCDKVVSQPAFRCRK